MLDVVNAMEAAARVVEGIDAGRLAASTDAYRDQLTRLDIEMTDAFAPFPRGRQALVTNHTMFLATSQNSFDFRVVGAVIPGGTTLAAPSAADLRKLSEAVRDSGVPTIFAESSQPDRLVQVLASESGLNVQVAELFTESLTGPDGGAATYLDMMRANRGGLSKGLEP